MAGLGTGHNPEGSLAASQTSGGLAQRQISPALRRSATGDSANDGLLAGPGGAGGTIRRTLTKTSGDINAMRSKKGVSKGTRTNDTLHQIGRLLDLHRGLKDPGEIGFSLQSLAFMCDRYLGEHTKDKEMSRIILVEAIKDEVMRDIINVRAQNRYLNDLRAGSDFTGKGKPAVKATTTPMSQTLTPNVAGQAHSYNNMRDQTFNPLHPAAKVVAVIKDAGLTEAEIAAIKSFTAAEYMYLNPAVANDEGWLDDMMPSIQNAANARDAQKVGQKTPLDSKKMKEQGTATAGVMMQGVAKMEPIKGTVYRGARMSDKEFTSTYARKSQITFNSFVSSSVEERPARNYANGGGSKKPFLDQTVSVICIVEVDDARDIQALSEIQSEKEWLLLPGATFTITSIQDDPNGEPGTPAATANKIVRMKQVRKPQDDFGGVREPARPAGEAWSRQGRRNFAPGKQPKGPMTQSIASGRSRPGQQRKDGRPIGPARPGGAL